MDMREKIEQAILEGMKGHSCVQPDQFDDALIPDIADAVLDAMREPTEEMGRVSTLVHKCDCGRKITQWGVNRWPAMIDAAKSS